MEKTIYGPDQHVLQELLREIRVERGLRQQDVAATIDEPQAIRQPVGQRSLDVLELRLICRAVRIRLEEFIARLEARLSPKRQSKRKNRMNWRRLRHAHER